MEHTLLKDLEKANIQGFVTSGYGHLNHTAYLFLRIVEDSAAGRIRASAWLDDLLNRRHITTAESWRKIQNGSKEYPQRPVNIAFSHSGLRRFGLDDGTLKSFPVEFIDGPSTGKRAEILGDTGESAPENWEFGVGANEIHILLTVMARTAEARAEKLDEIRADLVRLTFGAVEVEAVELGSHMVHQDPVTGKKVVKEHFGFNDGISQPEIRGVRRRALNADSAGQNVVNTGEMILGYQDELQSYPVTPLTHKELDPDEHLHESPFVVEHPDFRDFGFNGTYVVYRKLYQNVAAFWTYLRDQACTLLGKTDPKAIVWLAAKMVGRWPNGAPMNLAPTVEEAAGYSDTMNEFFFRKSDPDGSACPFGSHVRRSNPRDHLKPATQRQSLERSARHRILRRGSTFGEPLFDLGMLDRLNDVKDLKRILDLSDDGQPRGLQFLCVNANIRRQYEFIQQNWVIKRNFNGVRNNPDPIIGNGDGKNDEMHIPGNPNRLRTCQLPAFVSVRAAEYFFMPGMRALRYLAALNPPPTSESAGD
jgi:Dyp-type peroxidase family